MFIYNIFSCSFINLIRLILFSFHSAKYGSLGSATEKKTTSKKAMYSKKQDAGDDNIELKCVVNALNSLWVCKSAMNPKHECTYCLCSKCYMQKSDKCRDGNRTTRGRRNTMKSVDDKNKEFDDNESMIKCSSVAHHLHNLNQFVDSLYFSSAYKAKIETNNKDRTKKKKFVPFVCTGCHHDLVDK